MFSNRMNKRETKELHINVFLIRRKGRTKEGEKRSAFKNPKLLEKLLQASIFREKVGGRSKQPLNADGELMYSCEFI